MSDFIPFKNKAFTSSGFYVLKYENEYNKAKTYYKHVYASTPEHRMGATHSFLATTPNTRDVNTCHDFGEYIWVNSYTTYSPRPTHWRLMTGLEVKEFKKQLYRFDRAKWQRDNSDVKIGDNCE